MKKFAISRYIKKFLPLIVVLCIALTAAVYVFLSSSQEYAASTVIKYENADAVKGLAPDGSDLNVNEIKSSALMSKVTANLGLDERIYSIDSMLSRIKITEVIDEDEAARKQALLDEGEEYTEKPTTYIVSFTAKENEGEAFARRVLDELMNVYFSEYGGKYLNISSTVNPLSDIYDEQYDYVEMMDLIDDNISETLTALNKRIQSDMYFRSTDTGMSFSDLANEFNYLQSTKVAGLYSKIFDHQITKNKSVLVSDYTERINQNNISNNSENGKINDVLKIINDYVQKMHDSGNTNITHDYILDDVYEKEYTDSEGNPTQGSDQTVTYDKLIYSWRNHTDTREYAIIQSAYYTYLINTFSECRGTCGGTCAGSDKTCSAISDAGYAELGESVYSDIKDLVAELNNLHALAERTNNEYNEYLGAKNIATLSTVSVKDTVDVKLYTVIAALFLLIICCCGAILLGRINDIVDYLFYTDRLTGLNNRMSFDNYLKSRDKKILDDGVVCAVFVLTNQTELNRIYGRDGGDSVIKFAADTLRETFGQLGSFEVYNGNSQFIVFAERTDYITVQYALKRLSLLLEQRSVYTDADIEYETGLAETSANGIRNIRALLTKAMSKKEKFIAKATKETVKETTEE